MSTETKNAKEGFRALAESTFTGYRVDPRQIVVEKGYNARNFELDENKAHVQQLAEMIRAEGVQTPLTVRNDNGKIVLVDGESRLRAVMLLIKNGEDIKTVPAILEDKNTSVENRVASLITRNSGKSLNMVERATVFQRLQKYGWTEAQIAEKTGITTTHVGNILAVANAPASVQKAIGEGQISATLAVELMRDHGKDAAKVIKETIENAQESGKTSATKKHVTAEAPAKKKRNGKVDPLAFNRTQGKQMFAAMSEIYFDREIERPAVLRVIRDVFSDIIGSDWQKVAKDYLKSLDDEE